MILEYLIYTIIREDKKVPNLKKMKSDKARRRGANSAKLVVRRDDDENIFRLKKGQPMKTDN